MNKQTQTRGKTIFYQKMIGLAAMVIDHVGEFIPGMPVWFRWIGRLAIPLFLFGIVEGVTHTHDKKKYLMRLYLAGVVMALVKALTGVSNNIFQTFFVTACFLCILDTGKDKSWRIKWSLYFWLWQISSYLLIMVACTFFGINTVTTNLMPMLLGSVAFSEGGLYILIEGLVFYYCRGDKKKLAISYPVWIGIFAMVNLTSVVPMTLNWIESTFANGVVIAANIETFLLSCMPSFHPLIVGRDPFRQNYQWMRICALPILLQYNGEKGKSMKWFFYAFYVGHIVLLWWIGSLL